MQLYKHIPLVNALSPATGFGLPFIGNPLLNKSGLHLWRIRAADSALKMRRRQITEKSALAETLADQGVAVVENFLNDETFAALQNEVRQVVDNSERKNPAKNSDTERFGNKHHFDGGFDRYDGDTLNRFLDISAAATPLTDQFLQNEDLQRVCNLSTGTRFNTAKFQIYLTRQTEIEKARDPQLHMHRDTFFSCLKLWYFTEDVTLEDGPFKYCPGSHRMTPGRLEWEHAQSIHAARTNSGGSFRISEADLASLGFPEVKTYPVSANTLILADVRGFHARGPAQKAGAQRLSIYGNIRPWPFVPLAYSC